MRFQFSVESLRLPLSCPPTLDPRTLLFAIDTSDWWG
jgi:hypothetical protein